MVAGGLSRVFQRTVHVRGRMAGAGRRPAATARPGSAAQFRWRCAPRHARVVRRGWQSLAVFLALVFVGLAQAQVVSSRIWPARDYTRLTLDSKSEIKHSVFCVKDSEQLSLDLRTVELSLSLEQSPRA